MNPYNVVGLFLEDIRNEEGGRNTLIGVFSDNTNVTSIPGAFAKLAIYVRVHIVPSYEVHNLSLKLRLTNGEELNLTKFDVGLVSGELKKARDNDAPYAGFIFSAIASPAPVPTAGRLTAILTINEDEVVAVSMKIQQEPTNLSASVSLQPA
jgi:hypothetical protein